MYSSKLKFMYNSCIFKIYFLFNKINSFFLKKCKHFQDRLETKRLDNIFVHFILFICLIIQ